MLLGAHDLLRVGSQEKPSPHLSHLPQEAAGERAGQGCGLGWSLASVWSPRESWSVNYTTGLISPGSKRAVLCPHINQSLIVGCQRGGCTLPGKAVLDCSQFSRERGSSDPLITSTHISWGMGRTPITSATGYQIAEENCYWQEKEEVITKTNKAN